MNEKRQEYIDLRKRFLEERSNYPIAFAFNDDGLKKALQKLNATREEVCTLYRIGDVIRKADVSKIREADKRQRDELLKSL